MISSKGLQKAFFLALAALQIQAPAYCSRKGTVGIALEWSNPSRGTYTFVFAGQVIRDGQPCANARINLDLETASHGMITRTVQTGDDGSYQIEVHVAGVPQQASLWKLQALSGNLANRQSGEVEGCIILMDDQPTVVVSKAIHLEQA